MQYLVLLVILVASSSAKLIPKEESKPVNDDYGEGKPYTQNRMSSKVYISGLLYIEAFVLANLCYCKRLSSET